MNPAGIYSLVNKVFDLMADSNTNRRRRQGITHTWIDSIFSHAEIPLLLFRRLLPLDLLKQPLMELLVLVNLAYDAVASTRDFGIIDFASRLLKGFYHFPALFDIDHGVGVAVEDPKGNPLHAVGS